MENITKQCHTCGKHFLIIEQEQDFLAEKSLPLPDNCPTCRQIRRLALRGVERMLYKTTCQKCGKEIVVAQDPKMIKNKLYCRDDYEKFLSEHDPIITDPLPEL